MLNRQVKKSSRLSSRASTRTLSVWSSFTRLIGLLKSPTSFSDVTNWYNEAKNNVPGDCVYVLVGTKNDLERKVDYDEGVNLMSEKNFDLFFETSAKTGDKINEVFETSAKQILAKVIKKKELSQQKERLTSSQIRIKDENSSKKGCC